MVKRGVFIVIEGLDRSGKSTQVDMFHTQRGFITLNYPNRETKIGMCIDQCLKKKSKLCDQSIHLLFSANRWEREYFFN